jgi:hypothetical protein
MHAFLNVSISSSNTAIFGFLTSELSNVEDISVLTVHEVLFNLKRYNRKHNIKKVVIAHH